MDWDHEASEEEIKIAEELFAKAEALNESIKEVVALPKRIKNIDSGQRKTYIEELIKLYEQLADMGNIDAMYKLGNFYSYYPFYDRDKAQKWYERAANLGHQLSMYEIADMIHQDNPKLALQWLDKITDDYNPKLADAYYLRAELLWKRDNLLYPNSKTEALIYYSFAARYNHYQAALTLGVMYEEGYKKNGKEIIPPNDAWAGENMEIAYNNEEAGYYMRKATFRYARMLNTGRGVARNRTKAYLLFNEAAYEGNGRAMVELAQIYVADELFPVDNEMAYLWLLIAQAFDCHEYSAQRSRLIDEIHEKLTKIKVLQLENKASRCVNIIKSIFHLKDINKYIMNPEDYLEKHSYLRIPEAPEITAIATDQEEDKAVAEATIEDNDYTDEKEYIFKQGGEVVSEENLKEIKQNFDPNKVTFRIWIDKGIKENKPLDFQTLKVKYEGYSLQSKDMIIYSNGEHKICPQTRNLLFKLALAKYKEKDYSGMIKQGNKNDVTAINRLFKLLFPFYTKPSPAINRDAGKLNIQLEIQSPGDKTVIGLVQDAEEYSEIEALKDIKD